MGRRELFEGLYLYENWDWGNVYPVLHLDFGGGVIEGAKTYGKRGVVLIEDYYQPIFNRIEERDKLNQLQDITLSLSYATICGYTQAELETVFGELLTEEELQGLRS